MSAYTDTLNALRQARADRDAARDELYALQLEQLKLLRAQKRADRREVADRPPTLDAIAALRKRIADLEEQLRKTEQALREIDRLKRELKAASDSLATLNAELERLQQSLAAIETELNSPNTTPARRETLQAERAALLKRIEQLKQRFAALRQSIAELESKLRGAEENKGRLEQERERLRGQIAGQQRELDQVTGGAPAHDDRSEDLNRTRQSIPEKRQTLNEREKAVSTLIDRLFRDTSPQNLIEEWADGAPIMLLPLRLEVRFKDQDRGGRELWVRVFPDEVEVTAHEKVLTEREQEHGVAYWKALRAADNDTARTDAWRALADRFGANRAAWVALQTRPLNWSTPPPASDDDLQFPNIELTKPDSWTQAPHSLVMPDRFVLMAYHGTQRAHTLVGNQIADRLVLGPAPLEDEGNPSITRDPADNRLQFGDEFNWLIDFQQALDRGMAFKLPLTTPQDAAGFDQLLVLGLKLSADDKDAKKLVEDLIDNHHYSAKGFSLLRQGAATNNTDNDDAGFSSSDWLHDVSYFVETGNPLFAFEPDQNKASDGQRLAEYLGIDYAPLQYVRNADATDHSEAVAMNKALCAGTLSYYLHSMLNEVMSDATIRKLRDLFTDYVTGRGPIPAIRVGNQPYGVLLASAFNKWSYPREDVLAPFDPFEEQVRRVLFHLYEQWKTLKQQLSHISKSGNTRANLMNVLGLQPTSADYYQRVGYSYDYLRNLEEFAWGGRYTQDLLLMFFEQFSGRQFLKSFGYNEKRANGSQKPVPLLFQLISRHYHSRLDRKNLIDNMPLSEEKGIKPYDEATGKNYIDWLLENSGDADKLEHQDFGARVPKPNALLYLMLHNALLSEVKHSIRSLLERHEILADELVRSRKFMNISSQPDVSPWEVFRAPANRVITTEQSDQPLLSFVQLDRFNRGDEIDIGRYLNEAKEALQLLKDLPTARLERAFAEHIDTLNYRLDSWQTALFDRRVRRQRNLTAQSRDRRTGVYLGAYGYLENVKPAPQRRTRQPERVLPAELREGKENLYINPQNGGYVHTPSVNHATAAAILRNGYLTHATPEERDKLSVNLSSERVRRATYLIEGVRNGQTLEALLGYLFERGLHDWTTRDNPVILDQLKPIFRKAFPIKRTKVPRPGRQEPVETIEDYQVVNGLDLARTTKPFPYDIADMPSLDGAQIAAIQQEKNNLENSLDALRDVLTAECAYQLALGNFDRAAAIMQSLASGAVPVEIEVIRSSRGTELSFTNRVVVHFDTAVSANPWPPIPMTRRALTEPAFNAWAGDLLGDPATILCTVHAVTETGAPILDGGNPITEPVSLADLNLQPIDFVYLIRKKVEATGFSELETRIRYHFVRKRSLVDTTIVKIEFANSGGAPGARSFAEILPFADSIREMVGKARPLQAQDFVTPSKTVTPPADNPGNINVAELQSRVADIRADFDGLFSALALATTNAEALMTEPAVELLRHRLVDIANAGIVHAFPLTATGFAAEQLDPLLASSRSLAARYEALAAAYDASLATVNAAATKPPQKLTLLTEMARAFLGDDFALLPHFNFINTADVAQAHANRGQLLDYILNAKQVPLPVDEWLHGVSLVRPNMHTFGIVMMLSQTFSADAPPCSPIQLPFKDQDTWLGVDFPENTVIVHDTIAVVQCLPQGFQPAAAQAGLLVDEWTEGLPKKEEVTGIAFNFDQPNSAPPSAILLAVTPEETGKWKWDNLVDCVLDTFERAKLRAVEPDMIEKLSGFATLIPSTLSEFSTGRSTISLDYLLNIDVIFQEIMTLSVASGRP